MQGDDPLAGFEPFHPGADCSDLARYFVAENNGGLDKTVPVLGQIRAAEATTQYPQQRLAGPGLRHGHVLNANVARPVIEGCLHCQFPRLSAFSSRRSGNSTDRRGHRDR